MFNFNINNEIEVKLTETGKIECENQHKELNKKIGNTLKYNSPKEDSEGWSKWEFWRLMSTFGHLCYMGCKELPFENTIKISTNGSELKRKINEAIDLIDSGKAYVFCDGKRWEKLDQIPNGLVYLVKTNCIKSEESIKELQNG